MDQQKPPSSSTSNDTITDQKTLILEQSAHCDWDWWNTFHGYFKHGLHKAGQAPHQAVEKTLNEAIANMAQYQNKTNKYLYTFCEMAYLKRYIHENPTQLNVIKGLAQFLSLSSGGMTSADNLLSHGEAFIRNYLLGRQWAITELGITPTLQMWIPDDFGHDAQLPIVLQAMGFIGAGFWRVPANQPDLNCSQVQVPSSAPSSILTNSIGLDFIWQASDGSQVQSHWISGGYCQGNSLGPGKTIPWNSITQGVINAFIQQNLVPTNQPTPYLFVPVDCDFCAPYSNLPDVINDWNECNQSGDNCQGTQPSYVAGFVTQMGTFDQFMQLVREYTASGNSNGAALKTCYSNPLSGDTLFLPNPYFSGCYGSRPELKLLHYATTRTLMQAEAMEIFLEYLAFINPSQWSDSAADARKSLAEAWLTLVPSTHHDYITGTATDEVYGSKPPHGEQLFDLQKAFGIAGNLNQQILEQIAGAVPVAAASSGLTTVSVFNSLGFARSGVVQMTPPAEAVVSSVLPNSQNYFPTQQTQNADGSPTTLFVFEDLSTNSSVSSLGYATAYLSNHAATVTPNLSLTPPQAPAVNYQLSNEFISAVIGPQGLSELYDLISDPQQKNNLLGGGGFQIVFYNDSGNIYRFGNELPCGYEGVPSKFYLEAITLDSQSLETTESGPLRYTLTVKASALVGSDPFTFTTNYSLVYGEPFLRIAVTGAAPSGYSVMVKIPFPSAVVKLTYGTPYHWDTRAPRNYLGWPTADTTDVEGMTFEPTHEFVIPMDANDNYLAAIYHASTPGWAIDSKGALLGCILRNTPGTQQAASGTDSDTHTASLAIRVPGKPNTTDQLLSPVVGCNPGGPMGEALQFNNPLLGVVVPATSSSELISSSMSIASTSDPTAVITAVKAGTVNETDLILRLYQPTNSPLAGVQIDMDSPISKMYLGQTLNVAAQTALETPLDATNLSLQATATSVTLTAPFALTTLAFSRDAE